MGHQGGAGGCMTPVLRGMVFCLGLLLILWGGSCSYTGYQNYDASTWSTTPGTVLEDGPGVNTQRPRQNGPGTGLKTKRLRQDRVDSERRRIRHNGHSDNYGTYRVKYEYFVGGQRYTSNRVRFGMNRADNVFGRYPKGAAVTVYYDPAQVRISVLQPGSLSQWLSMTLWGAIPGIPGMALCLLGFFVPVAGGLDQNMRLGGALPPHQAQTNALSKGSLIAALVLLVLLVLFSPFSFPILVAGIVILWRHSRGDDTPGRVWVAMGGTPTPPPVDRGGETADSAQAYPPASVVPGVPDTLEDFDARDPGLAFRRAKFNPSAFDHGVTGERGAAAPSRFLLDAGVVAMSLGALLLPKSSYSGYMLTLVLTVWTIASVGLPYYLAWRIPYARMRGETRRYRKQFAPIHAVRTPAFEAMAAALHMRPAEDVPDRVLHSWRGLKGYSLRVFTSSMEGKAVYCFDYHDFLASSGAGSPLDPLSRICEKSPVDFTVVSLVLDVRFPELLVYPEQAWDRFAKRLGGIDIDMDSAEFSGHHRIWCEDRRFAYAICHGELMDLLMRYPEVALRTAADVMSFRFAGLAPIEELGAFLLEIARNAALVPRYLYEIQSARDRGMAALAQRLGFAYIPQDNALAQQYGRLASIIADGDNQVYNRIEGDYHGHKVRLFDYHYRKRRDEEYKLSRTILILFQDWGCAETHIMAREAEAHNRDIDPKQAIHDLSGSLAIWSANQSFATALLEHVDKFDSFEAARRNSLSIEIDGRCLAFSFNTLLPPARIEHWLDRLLAAAGFLHGIIERLRGMDNAVVRHTSIGE